MDSPSNPIDSRDQFSDKTQITDSLSDRDQKPEVSIEEDDAETMTPADSHATSSPFYCHGGGPKKKKGNNKKRKLQEEKSKEKLKVLVQTLKVVPFKPLKALDFTRHENLLKTLGLWDFVHLEFDQCIEFNLVAQLIASYSHEGRCGYVNGSRIKLSRADLARALKLPNKKERVVILDEDRELLESDESMKFIDDVVSDWILLHVDDAWMMPDEVVEWRKGLKEKQLDKLDWAGLFWIMIEKELKAEPLLGECYYASHLQMVIRSQKKELFSVEDNDVKVEDSLIEEDRPSRVEDVEVKEVDLKVNDDVSAVNLGMDDGAGGSKEEKCVDECMIELNLGQEIVSELGVKEEHHHEEQEITAKEEHCGEEQPMDHKENKEEEDEKWFWNGDNHAGSHFLQGCDVGDDATAGDEGNKTEGHREVGVNEALEEEIEEDGEKHEGGFSLFPNGVAQENLMLDDTSPLGYNSELQIDGNSTGDFLASRAGMQMVPSSSIFGNGNKREIDHENDMSYHFDNPATKRLRIDDGPSYDDKPVPFEDCMEQIKQLVDKAKVSYYEKDRACRESNMSQQMLLDELQRREDIIHQMQKDAYEEQQRKNLEIYKLENELRMMTSVVTGYRKTLKDTKKEYRKHFKRCPLRDQSLYKDVKGSGGLVLSTAEIEKLRLKQEEEERMRRAEIERQVVESGSGLIKEFEVNVNKRVELLEEKLTGFQNEVKLLKETVKRRKVLDTPERCNAAAET